MKVAYYLQVMNLSDIEIQDLLIYIYACKKYECDLTPFDVENRVGREHALLIAHTSSDAIKLDLFNYDSLAALGKEGYEIVSTPDKYEFFKQLTVGRFKYYK